MGSTSACESVVDVTFSSLIGFRVHTCLLLLLYRNPHALCGQHQLPCVQEPGHSHTELSHHHAWLWVRWRAYSSRTCWCLDPRNIHVETTLCSLCQHFKDVVYFWFSAAIFLAMLDSALDTSFTPFLTFLSPSCPLCSPI